MVPDTEEEQGATLLVPAQQQQQQQPSGNAAPAAGAAGAAAAGSGKQGSGGEEVQGKEDQGNDDEDDDGGVQLAARFKEGTIRGEQLVGASCLQPMSGFPLSCGGSKLQLRQLASCAPTDLLCCKLLAGLRLCHAVLSALPPHRRDWLQAPRAQPAALSFGWSGQTAARPRSLPPGWRGLRRWEARRCGAVGGWGAV